MLRRHLPATLALVFLAALLVSSAFIFVWPSSDTPTQASAVVVLSGAKNRLTKAEQLIRAGVAPVLAISSVLRTPNWHAALRLCRAGRYHGARVLCFEASPYSTRGEAENVARMARAHGWRSLVVVTSRYHIRRAKLLFERCFPGRVQTVGAPFAWTELPSILPSEWSKLVYALTVARDC